MNASGDSLVRARRVLARRGAWLEATPAGYALRAGTDRRARVLQVLDEAAFRRLLDDPGLRTRPSGGWTARIGSPLPLPAPPCGRPGVMEGSRTVMRPDGTTAVLRANLTSTAVGWLANRRGPDGQTWLTPAQVAAAERLGLDAEAALAAPSLTMRWDALPRGGSSGRAASAGPGDRALAAGRRVEAALNACGSSRALVEHVCVRASALQVAEQVLGLKRRTGRAALRQGLEQLAIHYRLT